jgi:uncharacterized protein (TIGR03067 family)
MAFAALLLLAAEPPNDAAKKDLEKIQGRWTVQQAQREGKDAPDQLREKMAVKIDGSKLDIDDSESARKEIAEINLDPSKSPAAIDLKISRPGNNETLFGIYKIDGETLSICWTKHGGERPNEFKTKPGSDQVLFVLTRPRQ